MQASGATLTQLIALASTQKLSLSASADFEKQQDTATVGSCYNKQEAKEGRERHRGASRAAWRAYQGNLIMAWRSIGDLQVFSHSPVSKSPLSICAAQRVS